LAVVFLLLVLWGYARINRIKRIARNRELQVKAIKSEVQEKGKGDGGITI